MNDDESYMEIQKMRSGIGAESSGSFVINKDEFSDNSGQLTETGVIQLRNNKKRATESDWESEADYEDFKRVPLDESFQSETSVHVRATPEIPDLNMQKVKNS